MKNRIALLATLALPLIGCWDLPPGDVTDVYYWSDAFLEKYADELVVGDLEPGPGRIPAPKTVLLITGVTIRAKWFDPIVARLKRDGFVPVVYEPPELLSGNLFEASAALKQVVERVQADSGQDKIDILAECTGGLIARYYIQSLGGDAHVSRMVTFVSPQHGIAKAPLAYTIAGWPALSDLSPGSAFLSAVNDAPLPANVPFSSIYTCTDEYIQPYTTSIIPGANNIELCDGFIGHFQTLYDPAIYEIMFGELTRPTADELAAAAAAAAADAADDTAGDDSAGDDTDDDTAGDDTDDAPVASDPAITTDGGVAAEPTADGHFEPTDDQDPQTLGAHDPADVGGLGCAGGNASSAALLGLSLGLVLMLKRRATRPS